VTVQLPGGWRISVPGGFSESWDAEGTYCAGQPPRTLWVTTLSFRDEQGSALERDKLLGATDGEPGERFEHEAGGLRGRAVLRRVEGSGGTNWELAAESALPGSLASCTIAFDDAADREWALATWRGLVGPPPGGEGG
jgi:hypothetical protein